MEAYPFAAPVPRAVKVAPTPVVELDARQNFNNPTEASILSVLVTAVPASILELAVTNPPELLSLFVSDFGDGTFPAWYTSLDADVQCYLTEGSICASYQLDGPTSTRSTLATSSSNSGLSTGAKAGIGVGVALGVLLLIGIAVGACLCMRRRKKNKVRKASQMPPAAAAVPVAQHQGQKYEAVPQTGAGYYQKHDGYVPQQQGQVPVQQQAPSPVSSYNTGYGAPSPAPGYEYNAGYAGQQQQPYGGQQYPPPQQQQGYAQGQPQVYQQHPPQPIPQQQPQPIPQQRQGPQAQELPTAAVSRPHELS